MLFDHRIYTTRPGGLTRQLALFGEQGYEVQKRHQGEPVAFLATESGQLNTYVHLWAYENAAHRESGARRRPRLEGLSGAQRAGGKPDRPGEPPDG